MWDDYVRQLSRGWDWPSYTPEGVMKNYHETIQRLAKVRERLKNPVKRNGDGPLRPATIRLFKNEEKELSQRAADYRQLIKCLVKYNLLPTNKLISGENRMQFVFTLGTMLELPELGRAVYYANRLMHSRYDYTVPSTDKEYLQLPPRWSYPKKKEESRESMYGALIDSLSETVQKLKLQRQRLLFSGSPWKPKKNDSNIAGTETTSDHCEKEVKHNDKIFKVLRGGLYRPA
jgi:hypothetical protein